MNAGRLVPLLVLATLMLTSPAGVGEGVPILFSGRDGNPVRFDFSHRETFVPPEMTESRLNRSASEAAAFIPLVDPSVTPNSGSSRRMLNSDKPERDWIFQNPHESETNTKRERDDPMDRDTSREPAMLRFLRGDSTDERGGDARDGKRLPDGNPDQTTEPGAREDERFNRRGGSTRDLTAPRGRRESLLSRIENDAGLHPPGPGMTLKNFFQAERHREREVRHREQMTEFRQLLNSPFGQAATGNGFGAGPNPLQENLPGVSAPTGLPGLGESTRPGLPAIGFGSTPGRPSAFDTPKVPTDFSRQKTFDERKPAPIRRRMNMDIPKRDF